MKKRILFLGAGFLQSFVIKRAKSLGYYVYAIDKKEDSVGFEYADEFKTIDIVDQEACLKYAKEIQVNGVVTVATDYGVLSAAYISEKLNLPSIDYDIAYLIKNKYEVRKRLNQCHTNNKKACFLIRSVEEIQQYSNRITYPVIVKPCDGSGSRGITKVDCFANLQKACEQALDSSMTGKAYIESFIVGQEYGVEAFVVNDEVHVLAILGKLMTPSPDHAELGHFYDTKLTIKEKIKCYIKDAIDCLGINFGAINMDILVTDENVIHIVDIGARMGGNLIGSHIIPYGVGYDYMGNIIRASVGDSIVAESMGNKKKVATRILALSPGKIIDLPDFESIQTKYDVDIFHHLKIGDTISMYHDNLDGCGYVLAVSDDVDEANQRVEHVKNLIDTLIVRA